MALGDGTTWDETNPTDATLAILIDDYDRDLRAGTRSRMALEHEWPSSQSQTSQAGMHKFITLQQQSVLPTLGGTQTAALFIDTNNNLSFNNGSITSIPCAILNYGSSFSTGTLINGAKICIGQALLPNPASSTQIISNLPFLNNTSYTVIGIMVTSGNQQVYVASMNASSFTLIPNGSGGSASWIAIGY